LNQTVIDLLRRALGVRPQGEEGNGLASLAGTWTKEEHEQFEAAVSASARSSSKRRRPVPLP
jgi:hypothetical protein